MPHVATLVGAEGGQPDPQLVHASPFRVLVNETFEGKASGQLSPRSVGQTGPFSCAESTTVPARVVTAWRMAPPSWPRQTSLERLPANSKPLPFHRAVSAPIPCGYSSTAAT